MARRGTSGALGERGFSGGSLVKLAWGVPPPKKNHAQKKGSLNKHYACVCVCVFLGEPGLVTLKGNLADRQTSEWIDKQKDRLGCGFCLCGVVWGSGKTEGTLRGFGERYVIFGMLDKFRLEEDPISPWITEPPPPLDAPFFN